MPFNNCYRIVQNNLKFFSDVKRKKSAPDGVIYLKMVSYTKIHGTNKLLPSNLKVFTGHLGYILRSPLLLNLQQKKLSPDAHRWCRTRGSTAHPRSKAAAQAPPVACPPRHSTYDNIFILMIYSCNTKFNISSESMMICFNIW